MRDNGKQSFPVEKRHSHPYAVARRAGGGTTWPKHGGVFLFEGVSERSEHHDREEGVIEPRTVFTASGASEAVSDGIFKAERSG